MIRFGFENRREVEGFSEYTTKSDKKKYKKPRDKQLKSKIKSERKTKELTRNY